jgi:hypothetical protein
VGNRIYRKNGIDDKTSSVQPFEFTEFSRMSEDLWGLFIAGMFAAT